MNNIFLPISSSENNQIKLLNKLKTKKYRQEFGQFMVENFVIIKDALLGGFDFEALFVTEEFADKHSKEIELIIEKSKSKNFYLINEKINKNYSELDTASGITAIYNIEKSQITKSSVVYLNGISDPGNLGAIIRNCLAFGFVNLVLDKTCVDVYNSKTINASKDAIFKLNISEDRDGSWLKETKLPVYTTSSHSGEKLSKFQPASDFCLVLGSESHGVSEELIKQSDKTIGIEMSDKIESLNVAAAAAILLYELRKK